MNMTRRQFLTTLGALGLSACSHIRVPLISSGDKGPFTVATLGDLHVLDARSTSLLNYAVARINETRNVRFTAILGDVTTSGKLAEFNLAKKSLDRLKMPYRAIPGNHDVQPRTANPCANFEKTFGTSVWTQEEGGWTFIGLDSCDGMASDVAVRPERVEWLKERIQKINADRPIALLTHHPFNPHTKQYRVKNADEILALFASHNLKLVASGHWHGNQEETQNGILFTTTACCASTRPNFDETPEKGYRLFHFDANEVKTEFVEVKV